MERTVVHLLVLTRSPGDSSRHEFWSKNLPTQLVENRPRGPSLSISIWSFVGLIGLLIPLRIHYASEECLTRLEVFKGSHQSIRTTSSNGRRGRKRQEEAGRGTRRHEQTRRDMERQRERRETKRTRSLSQLSGKEGSARY